MKTSSACSFIFMQIKVTFLPMVSQLDSLWNRGTRKLGNDLLVSRDGTIMSAPLPPMWPGFDSCPNTFQFDQDRWPARKLATADVASSLKISFSVRHKADSQVLIAQIMHKNSRSVFESRYLGTPIGPSKKFCRDEWRHLHVHPCVSFRVLRNVADFLVPRQLIVDCRGH